jgi:transposase
MSLKKKATVYSTRTNRYSKFPQTAILSIISEVENGLTRNEACIKYGMGYSTLSRWVRLYGFCKINTLTNQKRREIVRAITEGRMTIREAMLACNIICADTIRRWIKNIKTETIELADNNILSMPPLPQSEEQQNELTMAKLKITALETMIDIAEEEFKISIRKKYGAKQLLK